MFSLAVLVLALAAAGVAYDRWRAKERTPGVAQSVAAAEQTPAEVPPLPMWGSLLPPAEDAEVSGAAMCAFCHWKQGTSCNTVLQMSAEPGFVFVLPNQTRADMEKLTGECADGYYWITARGAITQYHGRNYLLAKSFTVIKMD